MAKTPAVKPGQIWADRDRRMAGRTFRVESIEGDTADPVAICTVLTNFHQAVTAKRRTVRIRTRRFRATSTGYDLVKEA